MGNAALCSSAPDVSNKMFLDKYDDSNASMMLKIVVMGRVSVGKSAITSRFAHGAYPGERYKPTTVANFAIKQFRFNNSTINAQVRLVAPRLHALRFAAIADT
jgi:GTPase SAR1 family protein